MNEQLRGRRAFTGYAPWDGSWQKTYGFSYTGIGQRPCSIVDMPVPSSNIWPQDSWKSHDAVLHVRISLDSEATPAILLEGMPIPETENPTNFRETNPLTDYVPCTGDEEEEDLVASGRRIIILPCDHGYEEVVDRDPRDNPEYDFDISEDSDTSSTQLAPDFSQTAIHVDPINSAQPSNLDQMNPQAAPFIPGSNTNLSTMSASTSSCSEQVTLGAEQADMPRPVLGGASRRSSNTTITNEPVDFSILCQELRNQIRRMQHDLCVSQLNEIALEKQNAALKEEIEMLQLSLHSAGIKPVDTNQNAEGSEVMQPQDNDETPTGANSTNNGPNDSEQTPAETEMTQVRHGNQAQTDVTNPAESQADSSDVIASIEKMSITEPEQQMSTSPKSIGASATSSRDSINSFHSTQAHVSSAAEDTQEPCYTEIESTHSQDGQSIRSFTDKLRTDLIEAHAECARLNAVVSNLLQNLSDESSRAQFYQNKYTNSLATKERADERFERASEALDNAHAMLQNAFDQWMAWRARHIELIGAFGVMYSPATARGRGEPMDTLVITQNGSGKAFVPRREDRVMAIIESGHEGTGV